MLIQDYGKVSLHDKTHLPMWWIILHHFLSLNKEARSPELAYLYSIFIVVIYILVSVLLITLSVKGPMVAYYQKLSDMHDTLSTRVTLHSLTYEVFVEDKSKNKSSTSTRPEYRCHGVLGIECADPFGPLRKTCERLIGFVVLFLLFVIYLFLIVRDRQADGI